jgi:hypothetical protein
MSDNKPTTTLTNQLTKLQVKKQMISPVGICRLVYPDGRIEWYVNGKRSDPVF